MGRIFAIDLLSYKSSLDIVGGPLLSLIAVGVLFWPEITRCLDDTLYLKAGSLNPRQSQHHSCLIQITSTSSTCSQLSDPFVEPPLFL